MISLKFLYVCSTFKESAFFSSDLTAARHFSSRVQNYTTLLLEDEKGILYVGARGAIFSLNSSNIADGSHQTISWEVSPEKRSDCLKKGKNNKTECYNHVRLLQRLNATYLYACGTYAFHPLCTYIDTSTFKLPSHFEEGREKCPYDPAQGYTGLIVDGSLYTATRYEFRSLPDIRRNWQQGTLRTEESPLHWLNDAEFVASVLVKESVLSPLGDDDKIYYFFTERAGEESTSMFDKTPAPRAARVARVCKNDLGGKKILQRKWTSFMKARLACYVPYYEVLKDVYSLDGGDWRSTLFYAAFTLSAQWRSMEVSVVCRYSISEVRAAFEGTYMEYQDSSRKWSQYSGEVPEPRPGSCITSRARGRGYNSSQDLPNSVLDFIKLHPLMYEEVKPADGGPLLVKKNAIYTQIAVDRVQALNGQEYDILFLGTGNGWIHKAMIIGSMVHIIEEIQVFRVAQPVENLIISKQQVENYYATMAMCHLMLWNRITSLCESLLSESQDLAKIGSLLQKGAIARISPKTSQEFSSRYFMVLKDGGLWPFLDLRGISHLMRPRKFCTVKLQNFLLLLRGGEWFTLVDLKDAYFHMTIKESYRCFLCFQVRNEAFQFTVFPFGLKTALHIYTKYMGVVCTHLCLQGVQVYPHSDYWLIVAPSRQTAAQATTAMCDPLSHMGLYINTEVPAKYSLARTLPEQAALLHAEPRSLYVGAQNGVLQLPLSSCKRYTSCFDCILARDPYCGWDGESCRELAGMQNRSLLIQDVLHGNMGCQNDSGKATATATQKKRTVLRGDDVLLPCEQASNLAQAAWLVNGTELLDKEGQDRFRLGVDGLLLTDTQLEDGGEYRCYAKENGLQALVASYALTVLPKQPVHTMSHPSWHAATHAYGDKTFIYIAVITVLTGLCVVLSVVLSYVYCAQKHRGKYSLGVPQTPSVELQTVSSNCLGKGRQEEAEEELSIFPDGCLQIIPGEAPTLVSPSKEAPPIPPPPPPPLPAEFTNGIPTLPNMLRKMNGNSYMLLRQNEEPCTSPLYNSFTEELSKILEKRKHTQLVEKLDESSV
ncbi:Semaphorin-4G [Varanus komodoensis]|nr:Semaphorin-4G [Varanus komodoensis]